MNMLALAMALALQNASAPELDGHHGWLNTDKPLRMADLRGKIVLLDFWTYCCINCHHVFPDLRRLEEKYAKELVVIGVHSAKFRNERDAENLRKAVLRHDLRHPVVNDADMKIFNAYRATGWPHFVLVDPEGRLYGRVGGEGNYDVLDEHIGKLVKQFEGKLDRAERTFRLEKEEKRPLAFPGKILATADRLFVADTNHHRILVLGHDGKVQETIGGPTEGRADGDFRQARFRQPQGIALDGDRLYVADTENHAIRVVDLKSRSVATVAGDGRQVYDPKGRGPSLNSPWDVAVVAGGQVFVAMAGNHQIWTVEPSKRAASPFSGTGAETLTDGPHATAAFSQPSGLTVLGRTLYVADAEVSGIRAVDLSPSGAVRTLVGTGLFDYGDADGVGTKAKLQHVLGVHAHAGRVYLADAYNHKIKVLDPETKEVRTLFGDGQRGAEDQPGWPKEGAPRARFSEPGGLWAVGDVLFVADTNNHAIRRCDLKSGEVRTLRIEP